MRKFILFFLSFSIISSLTIAQMKLHLPSDIDVKERVSKSEFVSTKSGTHSGSYSLAEAPVDATSLIPGTILVGLLGDVTFPFGEDFKNYAGTGWSVHGFGGYSILNSIILGAKVGYIRFGEVETDFGQLAKTSQVSEGVRQYNTQFIINLLVQYLIQTGSFNSQFSSGQSTAVTAFPLQIFVGFGFCLIFKNFVSTYFLNTGVNKLAKTVQNGEEFESSSTIVGITPSVGMYINVSEDIRLIFSADYYYIFDKADEDVPESANINYLSINFGVAYSIL